MRNYSLETLQKQLAKAEEQYCAEVMRLTGMEWGYTDILVPNGQTLKDFLVGR